MIPELAVLSAYARHPSAGGAGAPPRRVGFLNRRHSVGSLVAYTEMVSGRAIRRSTTLTRVTSTFYPDHALNTPFKSDEWNLVLQKVRAQLEDAVGVFVDFVMEPYSSIGR